jgi:hypothetical protein
MHSSVQGLIMPRRTVVWRIFLSYFRKPIRITAANPAELTELLILVLSVSQYSIKNHALLLKFLITTSQRDARFPVRPLYFHFDATPILIPFFLLARQP